MAQVLRLDAEAMTRRLDELAEVLRDCVEGGASVNFLLPFTHADARAFFEPLVAQVAAGERIVLAATDDDGRVVGTVQVVLKTPPNQPHRGDVAKLLVHRSARGAGVAQMLMDRVEVEARAAGKSLLVLDTVTGQPAEPSVHEARLAARRRDSEFRTLTPTVASATPRYSGSPSKRPFLRSGGNRLAGRASLRFYALPRFQNHYEAPLLPTVHRDPRDRPASGPHLGRLRPRREVHELQHRSPRAELRRPTGVARRRPASGTAWRRPTGPSSSSSTPPRAPGRLRSIMASSLPRSRPCRASRTPPASCHSTISPWPPTGLSRSAPATRAGPAPSPPKRNASKRPLDPRRRVDPCPAA